MNKSLTILFVVLALGVPALSDTPITVVNPSFESGATGWSGITVDNSEFYSPVDGTVYATSSGGAGYTTQMTGETITAGKTYKLTVWARSTNSTGNTAATTAEARCYYGSTTIKAVTADVNPVRLLGDPRNYPNDDGGNVWIDQGYRMEFADGIFYQLESADPLYDSWTRYNDSDYSPEMAAGPIITPQGLKGIYWTYYEEPSFSEIWFNTASGSPPDYTWSSPVGTVLHHDGDETPWCIDAHLYYDSDTGKLWMSWGGLPLRVSEMDPSDGKLIDHPASTEFDDHPLWYHTAVANWNGDEWSSDWAEGPALFKNNGYWYFLASYGHLAQNYTIRGGRGTSPTGPYYDKDGVDLMVYDSGEAEYGNTIFLGADGGQANPGHPHIWEESGKFYMGFDYTDEYDSSGTDRLGIRRLYWVNDWPTIYTPVVVEFNADDYPSSIGQTLGISIRNVGDAASDAAFDYVSLAMVTPDTDPPSPDPMTWASVPTADDQDSISMTATTATDPSGVQYYFDETSGNPGGSDSGWQSGTGYNDDGLSPETQYTYTVTARDNSINHNETAASTAESATTDAGPVFADNFESATDWTNNWTAYGAWQRVTTKPYDGSYSAEIDGNVTDSALVSVAIDVASKTDATVTFAWYIESQLDSGEYLRFDVDTGSGWVQKASLDGNVDTENVWHNENIPVDVSAASTMSIRFRGKISGSNEDAYVDVVEVTATGGEPDTTPPSPDPMTWASVPSADGDSAISMTATTATDPSGVEYYFDETSGNPGGSDSIWQDGTYYQDTGLNAGTQYCYEVAARDKSVNQNETAASSNQCATTTAPDTDPPTPDPMTWASVPAAGGTDNISMTATTATDPSGVSYYFDETSGNPGGSDSGWQPGTGYTDDGLTAGTQYAYQVKARDNSANQNETAWSTPLAYATTDAGCSPTDCHVEAMVCSEQSCGGPNKNGVATVTIYDDCGDPVVGADVYGTFTGSFSEQVMDTTDGNGVAVLVSTGCLKKPTFQVCVDDVDHTLPYDSGDNVVTCCND